MFKFCDEKTVKKNLKNIWENCEEEYKEEGKIWYEQAHLYCQEISNVYSVPLIQSTSILSALSPMTSWEENKKRLELFYEKGIIKHTTSQKQKIEKLIQVEEVDRASEILNGLKTINFFQSIYKPSDPNPFCIDRWMIRACLNFDKTKLTTQQYQWLTQISKKEAKRLKLIPNQYQAIIWCKIRTL